MMLARVLFYDAGFRVKNRLAFEQILQTAITFGLRSRFAHNFRLLLALD